MRGGVGQERDPEISVCLNTQAVSVIVRYLAPADAGVEAALLRYRVGGQPFGCALGPHAQGCSGQAVRVGLDGAEAIETQAVNRRGECPLEPEAWHRWEIMRTRVGCR